MRFTSVIPRLITTMLAAAAAARGSAPASTSTTWTMPAATATSRIAAGPASASAQTGAGVPGSRSKTVTPPKRESEMWRGVRPIHRPTSACPTSWSTSEVMSPPAAMIPVATYETRPRPGAAAGNTASANVHVVSPMASRHEMSGRTAMASVETPPAARNAPMRGRGAGRTTDDAIAERSGGQRVHRGRQVFGADPDVGHRQHRRMMRPHEQRMSDVGVRHLLVDGLAQEPLLGQTEGGLQRLERFEHVRKIAAPELEQRADLGDHHVRVDERVAGVESDRLTARGPADEAPHRAYRERFQALDQVAGIDPRAGDLEAERMSADHDGEVRPSFDGLSGTAYVGHEPGLTVDQLTAGNDDDCGVRVLGCDPQHGQKELGRAAAIGGLQDAADARELAELGVVVCTVITGDDGEELVRLDQTRGPVESLTEQDVARRRGNPRLAQSAIVWAAHGAMLGTAGENDAPEVVCHH